jgi:hypothetical protein
MNYFREITDLDLAASEAKIWLKLICEVTLEKMTKREGKEKPRKGVFTKTITAIAR